MSVINRKKVRDRIHRRVRRKISGTAERPRLSVSYSNKHMYAQIIDDEAGHTLAAASTLGKDTKNGSSNVEGAKIVGKAIAEVAQKANVTTVVFDRGGHLYHGKVKALAEAAREGGLKF